jgi:CheY-like chemotaxis protein
MEYKPGMDEPDRILVVDDDADIRELLTQYLCKQGLRASAVADGRQMRAFLANHTVDLIVLDLMLPGIDGLALCRELRSGPQAIPVLMLTARGDEADRPSRRASCWRASAPSCAARGPCRPTCRSASLRAASRSAAGSSIRPAAT